MLKKLLSVVVAAGVVAVPLGLVPTAAQAKTEKQLRDEHKGKVAKEKSAAKSAARKEAKKSGKK